MVEEDVSAFNTFMYGINTSRCIDPASDYKMKCPSKKFICKCRCFVYLPLAPVMHLDEEC
jgi:hypothetical protein